MKIHPFIKSLILVIVFAIILFLAKGLILTQASFEWFNNIEEDKILNKIFCNLSLSSMISLSFTLPFLFFNKNTFWKFLKWTFSISIFSWMILIIIANDLASNFYPFKLFRIVLPFLEPQIILFAFFFPLGIFLITRIFLKVTIKLFLLLLLVFPIGIGMDSFDLFQFIFGLPSNSDFNIFFSIILFLNIISNFYFIKLNFQEPIPIHIEENILDAPDL